MATPKQVAKVVEGARLANMLPYLEAEVEGLEKAIDNEVAQAMAKGALDPQFAVQKWVEKTALNKILKRLSQKIKVCQGVATEIGPQLDLPIT